MIFFGPKYKQIVISVFFHVMTPCSLTGVFSHFREKIFLLSSE